MVVPADGHTNKGVNSARKKRKEKQPISCKRTISMKKKVLTLLGALAALGLYDDVEEAVKAYDNKSKE